MKSTMKTESLGLHCGKCFVARVKGTVLNRAIFERNWQMKGATFDMWQLNNVLSCVQGGAAMLHFALRIYPEWWNLTTVKIKKAKCQVEIFHQLYVLYHGYLSSRHKISCYVPFNIVNVRGVLPFSWDLKYLYRLQLKHKNKICYNQSRSPLRCFEL
jgi:hypothetical protein